MQTFGTRNLLCQWIPKFNYALCEKLFWGLKYLTSFHFRLLILLLWLKANTECTFPMSKCATSRGGTGPCPVPLPGWRLCLIPCADVIPALGAHFSPLSAPFQLKGNGQAPKEGIQGHCFLLYSEFFQFITIFALLYRNLQQTHRSGSKISFLSTDNKTHSFLLSILRTASSNVHYFVFTCTDFQLLLHHQVNC